MARSPKCDWCGVGLEEDEGLRLIQPKRNLGASFCRLEHMVPWLMKKNDWHIWPKVEVPESAGPDGAAVRATPGMRWLPEQVGGGRPFDPGLPTGRPGR